MNTAQPSKLHNSGIRNLVNVNSVLASLSMQKHFKRSEQWIILEGVVKMETEYENRQDVVHLDPSNRPYDIGIEVWHQASNPNGENAHILEIQWGSECVEEDIERRD